MSSCKFIYICIYENPFIKRSVLIKKIDDKFKVKYTLNDISKIYKQLKLTFKKPKYRIIRNIEFLDELIKKRQDFVTKIKEEDIHKIISIDESGFNDTTNKTKGLSKKGSAIYCPVKAKKHQNVSLIMAITTKQIIYHDEITTSLDGKIFFIVVAKATTSY